MLLCTCVSKYTCLKFKGLRFNNDSTAALPFDGEWKFHKISSEVLLEESVMQLLPWNRQLEGDCQFSEK